MSVKSGQFTRLQNYVKSYKNLFLFSLQATEGIFGIQMNIYHGDFLQKK